MMGLYEKFATKYENKDKEMYKIRKPMIFKSFCKFILNQNEHVNQQIKQLQKYIKQEGLMREKNLNFCHLYDENPFLAMKGKQKKKIEADDPTRIHLTYSDTDSDDYKKASSEITEDYEQLESKWQAFGLEVPVQEDKDMMIYNPSKNLSDKNMEYD